MAAVAVQRENQSLPADLRDMLTRSRLEGAVAHLAGVEVLEFENDWWDGQAHAPCLIVRGGRKHRLLRVVETGGDAVVVPFDRKDAERWLAVRRQPARTELGVVPAPRAAQDIVLDATADVRRCSGATCGALLPMDYAGPCPVCGGTLIEEKPTATGARTVPL
jgi:hypothetical protein